jgi:hypothetical protein
VKKMGLRVNPFVGMARYLCSNLAVKGRYKIKMLTRPSIRCEEP